MMRRIIGNIQTCTKSKAQKETCKMIKLSYKMGQVSPFQEELFCTIKFGLQHMFTTYQFFLSDSFRRVG